MVRNVQLAGITMSVFGTGWAIIGESSAASTGGILMVLVGLLVFAGGRIAE